MNVRELKAEDIPACADILCSVYNNELWQCRWDRETAEEYLTDIFQMKKFVGYVIEEEGVVLGSVYAHEKVWWNNSEIVIEEIFIRPQEQRKGYGATLLRKIEEYVKEKGMAGITLLTNKYAPAPRFYRKNGFVDCEHILYLCKEV